MTQTQAADKPNGIGIPDSREQLELGLLLTDPLLFTKWFWKDDLTISPQRLDLPGKWRGKQVLSLEQRLMCLDGAMWFLFRDDMPDEAAKSSRRVCVRTARKLMKTIIFESHYIQAAVCQTSPGLTEGLFHAPNENHIEPVLKRIDNKVDRTPFFRLLHGGRNRSSGIDEWRSGDSRRHWHRRIEGSSNTGKNMIGLRAFDDLGDEADYGNEPAYSERQQTDLPNAFVFWAGVPHGVRGPFWSIARTRLGDDWSKHVQGIYKHLSYDMRANPIYHSNDAWANEIKNEDYDSHRVQTQVLGYDGQEAMSTFPVIPVDPSLPFCEGRFQQQEVPTEADAIAYLTKNMNTQQVLEYDRWMIHCDYGFSPSPMVIGVSYEKARNIWVEFARFTGRSMDNVTSAMFLHVLNTMLPSLASLIVIDAHGRGAGTLEILQNMALYEGMSYGEIAIPAGFETYIQDERVMIHKACNQPVRMTDIDHWQCDACRTMGMTGTQADQIKPMVVQAKTVLTADLAESMATGQRYLNACEAGLVTPFFTPGVVLARDTDLIYELQGTTTVISSSGAERFVPPDKQGGHSTDSWLALMRGIRKIQEMSDMPIAAGVEEFGWA